MEKFWKAALAAGGVCAIGAFVFLSIYKEWLTLDIFGTLTSNQTFIIMSLFLVLVFLLAIATLIAWIIDRRSQKPPKSGSVSFTIPDNCSFRQAARALAKEAKATIIFSNIPDNNLDSILKNQPLSASTTKRVLELLGGLSNQDFPKYEVTFFDGKYVITAS